MKPIDVVALRAACVDIVLKVPRLPGYDEKLMGSLIGWLPGELWGISACALSRLGVSVGWSGSLGDDHLGRLVLEDFQRFWS